MKLITSSGTIDFRELGYVLETVDYDQLPSRDFKKEKVIGLDGEYRFNNGLNNKSINVRLSAIDDSDLYTRRVNIRDITPSLLMGGRLILDYESDLNYDVVVIDKGNISFNASYDELDIQFDAKPLAYSNLEGEDLEWATADITWASANIPWTGNTISFSAANEDIAVYNYGNTVSLPIITITGSGNISVTHSNGKSFSLTGISGIINIDAEYQNVYDDSNANQISKFSGDFIGLSPGANVLTIVGTITIAFENKDRVV